MLTVLAWDSKYVSCAGKTVRRLNLLWRLKLVTEYGREKRKISSCYLALAVDSILWCLPSYCAATTNAQLLCSNHQCPWKAEIKNPFLNQESRPAFGVIGKEQYFCVLPDYIPRRDYWPKHDQVKASLFEFLFSAPQLEGTSDPRHAGGHQAARATLMDINQQLASIDLVAPNSRWRVHFLRVLNPHLQCSRMYYVNSRVTCWPYTAWVSRLAAASLGTPARASWRQRWRGNGNGLASQYCHVGMQLGLMVLTCCCWGWSLRLDWLRHKT